MYYKLSLLYLLCNFSAPDTTLGIIHTTYLILTTTILQMEMETLETGREGDIDIDVYLISNPMAFLLLHVCKNNIDN